VHVLVKQIPYILPKGNRVFTLFDSHFRGVGRLDGVDVDDQPECQKRDGEYRIEKDFQRIVAGDIDIDLMCFIKYLGHSLRPQRGDVL
jgi:hypothetical protein